MSKIIIEISENQKKLIEDFIKKDSPLPKNTNLNLYYAILNGISFSSNATNEDILKTIWEVKDVSRHSFLSFIQLQHAEIMAWNEWLKEKYRGIWILYGKNDRREL